MPSKLKPNVAFAFPAAAESMKPPPVYFPGAQPVRRLAASPTIEQVYAELRTIAAKKLATERPGHTLQPTALVHEAYLRLGGAQGFRFENRAHFFAAAA